jgi:hypothetical protein
MWPHITHGAHSAHFLYADNSKEVYLQIHLFILGCIYYCASVHVCVCIYLFMLCVHTERVPLSTQNLLPLGSVGFLLSPKIKSLGKYLFSRHPKHTIGICSLRYIQIQGEYKSYVFLQKLENPKSLIFFRKNTLQHERIIIIIINLLC